LEITAEIRDRILSSLDIVDIISEVVQLNRKGANYWALCPFHSEKTPSFSVSATKGIYKCFGCGVSGNIITFQMEYYKMSYPEAVRELAKRAGIHIEDRPLSPSEIEKQSKRDLTLGALKATSDYYHKMLKATSGKEALGYLRKRGFSDELITRFELGYSPDAWDALIVELRKQNFADLTMIEAGLVIERDDGDIYDRFRNRVMFPIHDHLGKIVGFGARLLDDEIKQAKYINSPQTIVYDKSKVLYGLFHSKDEIRKSGFAILTEGYADVLTLHQAGYQNAIASSGTSLTREQLNSLFRYCKTIYLVFDADEAGIKATERGLELALEQGFNVLIVELPSGEDPDSIIRNLGGKNFQVYIDQAVNFLDYLIKKYSNKDLLKNPTEKAKSMRYFLELICKIPDRLQHDEYIKNMAQMMNLTSRQIEQVYKEKAILEKNKTNLTNQSKPTSGNSGLINKETIRTIAENKESKEGKLISDAEIKRDINEIKFYDKLLPEEVLLLQLLLLEKDSRTIITNVYNLTEEKFHSDLGKSILKNLLRMLKESSDIAKSYFDDELLTQREKQEITNLIFTEVKFSEKWKEFSNRNTEVDMERMVKDTIIRLELLNIENRLAELQGKLLENKQKCEELAKNQKDEVSDAEELLEKLKQEQHELLKEQMEISSKRKKLNQLFIR
jgi:DNA primase